MSIGWKTLNDEAMSLSRQGRYYSAINVANKALQVAEQAGDQSIPMWPRV